MKIKNTLRKTLNPTPHFTTDEKIILRDFLALQRTKLANERTLLSYTKFSLYLAGGGVALIKIDYLRPLKLLGYVALGCSALVLLVGVVRFVRLNRQLKAFYQDE